MQVLSLPRIEMFFFMHMNSMHAPVRAYNYTVKLYCNIYSALLASVLLVQYFIFCNSDFLYSLFSNMQAIIPELMYLDNIM